jgi:hypothetical protein
MKMNRSSVVVEFRLVSVFEETRRKLLSPEFADRLDKPLGYWALPTDRSAPIALMGRSLRDLLNTPFEQLFATPGIGQKKINSLVELLERAAQPEPPGAIHVEADKAIEAEEGASADGAHVDTSIVSEALWVQWQQTVRDHGLGKETLGRFSPSLQSLPRVIWNTPLDAYTELTLAEIRALKTHGEKRVRAVLEVFGGLHSLLARVHPQRHLAVRILPSFVARLDVWATSVLRQSAAVDAQSIRTAFVEPLMVQLRIDAGEQIAQLAETRLRLDGSGASVRQVARRMGLTRARVYQLLGDVGAMMNVRWPEGSAIMHEVKETLHSQLKDASQLELFDAVCELFFGSKRDGHDFAEGESLSLEGLKPRAQPA